MLKLFNRFRNKKKKSDKGSNKKSFSANANRKIIFILVILTFLIVVIFSKLFYLQVLVSDKYTRLALRQITGTEVLNSERGIIYDRNLKELALNVACADAYYNMDPDANPKNDKESLSEYEARYKSDLEADAEKIAAICSVNKEELLEKMKGEKPVKIISDVERSKTLELRDAGIRRLSLEDKMKRSYPYKNLGSHVIGFVNDENIGQYGVESGFDSILSGISGKIFKYRQGGGGRIPLTDQETFAPKEGLFLGLTMDINIQQIAEEAAREAKARFSAEKVSIIVQDTQNSEILAMANIDDYDLNKPREPQTPEQREIWPELTDQQKVEMWFKNWRNFAVNDIYEPGSTFKLVTAASAIEAGTSWPDKTYYCTGAITDIPGVKRIGCTCTIRGAKTMAQALEQSCNISFVQLGRELGRQNMLHFIRAFGFGERTGIELPAEEKGKIPASVEAIGPAELATLSYGHGIACTPLQLINAVSAIANGGELNVPRIGKTLMDADGNVIETFKTQKVRQVISKSTSKTMLGLMERVVLNGTGKRAKVDGYRVGGKTGTANMISENGNGYAQGKYVASFVGVAPINDPKITVLVVVKDPQGLTHGGTVAAPYGSYVIGKTLSYLKVQRTEGINQQKDANLVQVPDVSNLLIQDAGKALVTRGLKFNVTTENSSGTSVVKGQSVEAGAYVKQGTIIDLEVENNMGSDRVMPNLIDKTKEEAISILKDLKVEYNAIGEGIVKSQTPKAGSILNKDTMVDLEFDSEDKADELIKKSGSKGLVKDAGKDDITD